jgi:hypothetical protein
MVTNGYLFYALPFLELYPEYECPIDLPNCNHRDRCLDPIRIRVNWDSSKSLDNWVERLDLECAEPYMIGMLGSS